MFFSWLIWVTTLDYVSNYIVNRISYLWILAEIDLYVVHELMLYVQEYFEVVYDGKVLLSRFSFVWFKTDAIDPETMLLVT